VEPRDDERIRLFLAARGAGDERAARAHWDALVTANFDRVKIWVQLEARTCRLDEEERDDALFRAIVRLSNNMIATFRGSTKGEWVNATRQLVRFACQDAQRRAAVHSGRERSFDPAEHDHEVYAALEQQRRAQEADERERDVLAEGRAFLDWALPQLARHRRGVLELDREGVPVEAIERRLGVSRDVVYQSRRRALQDLDKLREQWPR
jgi:hypothetical protein